MTLALLAVIVAAAAVVAAASIALLRRLHSSPVVQVVLVALAPALTVAAGWLAGTAADIDVHSWALVGAGTAAAGAAALSLAGQLRHDAEIVGVAARRLDEGIEAGGSPSSTLANIARDLDATAARLGASRTREFEREASRREMVAWVSHDLRAPLAGVRVIAEALRDGVAADPHTLMTYVEALQFEVDRLDRLVTDLFELSSVQSGAQQLAFQESLLSDSVSDALATMGSVAAAKGVRLEGRVVTPVPPLPLATREIERALQNLIDNAIRETAPDGTVSVELARETGYGVVAVTDECGGIADEQLDRIFSPGFRASSEPAGRSSGLGLAIAAAFVQAHDGDIAVRNVGSGCRFEVRLPLPGEPARPNG